MRLPAILTAGACLIVLIATVAVPRAWDATVDEVFSNDPIDCDDFEFSADEWKSVDRRGDPGLSGRERMATGLVRCKVLVGITRAEVKDMLGRRPARRKRARYHLGSINDYMGPGDAGALIVYYDGEGRVSKASAGG